MGRSLNENKMHQILTEQEIRFLQELNNSKIPFLIVGMMAAALQDAPFATQDVDLWFKNTDDPQLVDVAQKCGGVFIPANMIFQMPPLIMGEAFNNLDIVYGIQGLSSFDEEYKQAIEMDMAGVLVKVLPLDRVIASKEATGRAKDKATIPALKTVLLARQGAPKTS